MVWVEQWWSSPTNVRTRVSMFRDTTATPWYRTKCGRTQRNRMSNNVLFAWKAVEVNGSSRGTRELPWKHIFIYFHGHLWKLGRHFHGSKKMSESVAWFFFMEVGGGWWKFVKVSQLPWKWHVATSMEASPINFHGTSWNLMEPHGTNTFVSTSMKVEACIYFHGSSWKLHGSAAQVLPWK